MAPQSAAIALPRPASIPSLRRAMRLRCLAFACACLSSAPVAFAQDDLRPLAERLTPEQMRETGLDGLTPEQLAKLDAILRGEIATEVAAAKQTATAEAERRAEARPRNERDIVVSRIAGTFAGWSPGTRFTLANGQTWRVVESNYYVAKSKASEGPAVVVQPGMFSGYYLQVEGHVPKAKVQRAD
jgi:hypothetical protein